VAALPRIIKIKTVKILSGTQLFLDFFSNNSVFRANMSLRFVTDSGRVVAPKLGRACSIEPCHGAAQPRSWNRYQIANIP
jgi:hypothetical protein